MLKDLEQVISIDSELGKAEENAPFGVENKRALDWFIDKANSYGLETYNYNGYYGYAQYGSGKIIGILAHIDVVPAGDGWSQNPFKLVNDNGILYGRGVADDKGPLVTMLHVLKKLKEENVQLNHCVRLIVGCNEENGSACIKEYVKRESIPVVSLVPDADFPCINSEKGIMHLLCKIRNDSFINDNLVEFCGGVRANVVADKCNIVISHSSPLYNKLKQISPLNNELFTHNPFGMVIAENGLHFDDFNINDDSALRIQTNGIAGHASTPEQGENAINKMLILLSCLDNGKITKLANTLCYQNSKTILGLDGADKSGNLTTNIGLIKKVENGLDVTIDIRKPLLYSKDEVIEKLSKALDSEIEVLSYSDNLYVSEDDKLIKTLLKIYSDETGENAKAVQTGGGTYARELPNAVAFGPTFPGRETFIHNADECIPVTDLYKLGEIYYKAILALDKIY